MSLLGMFSTKRFLAIWPRIALTASLAEVAGQATRGLCWPEMASTSQFRAHLQARCGAERMRPGQSRDLSDRHRVAAAGGIGGGGGDSQRSLRIAPNWTFHSFGGPKDVAPFQKFIYLENGGP